MVLQMDFKRIEPADRERVEQIQHTYGHGLSSHAFCSLYLWQNALGLTVYLEDDLFVVRCRWKGANCFFFPCGNEGRKEAFIREHMHERDFKLCYMNAADVDVLCRHFPKRFVVKYDRSSCEYIYDKAEVLEMPGGKFAKTRTKLHRLEREHSLRAEQLTVENKNKAVEIIEAWARSHERDGQQTFDDTDVALQAMDQMDMLGLVGAITYMDGEPYAVTAGCGISDSVFDLCVAKQKAAVPGLDYYAKICLYSTIPEKFIYINAEEDVGIPGLRTHKMEMRPMKLEGIWEGTTRLYEKR
ncbi:MAG: phosphatidylglycerol lysyltransferase domain-containing protein [Eubacteriales bacterium]